MLVKISADVADLKTGQQSIKSRLDNVESGLSKIEHRLDKVESRFDNVEAIQLIHGKRIDEVVNQLEDMEAKNIARHREMQVAITANASNIEKIRAAK